MRRKVAVLVSTGGAPSVMAAKAATSTIPIVFTSGGDPIRLAIVTSLSHPGGNITGVNLFLSAMESKRLGLLRALVPGVQLIAVLLNPNRADQCDSDEGSSRTSGRYWPANTYSAREQRERH